MQTALLPFLLPPKPQLRSLYLPYHAIQDVCASAPTGSGKTLAYVVPIVEVDINHFTCRIAMLTHYQILSKRISTKLRALIVLPTRDLVLQVQETFEAVSKGRGLKVNISLLFSTHSCSHVLPDRSCDWSTFVCTRTNAIDRPAEKSVSTRYHVLSCVLLRDFRLQGGSSKVDILICTPGRLIDHLNGTLNFTLQHLRFLVRTSPITFEWFSHHISRSSTRPTDC